MSIDNYTSHLMSYQHPFSSIPCHDRYLLKRPKVLVHNLMSRRSRKLAKQAKQKAIRMGRFNREMEIKNLKLYMANKIIVDENEKLKRKAMELLQENKILQSQLQKNPELAQISTC